MIAGHQWFKFDVIRFTGYGVIAKKPRVGQLGRIFCAPCRKNYALDRKMNNTFVDGLDGYVMVFQLDLIPVVRRYSS